MAFVPVLVLSALVLSCSGQAIDDYDSLDLECARENMYHCNDGACVPFSKYCDGEIDCPDGSDENLCVKRKSGTTQCSRFEHYLCKDQNKCIPFEWMCNNVTECDDGSDEEDCTIMPEPDKNATCKGFACDGGRCISNLWICDGRYDCDDRSDEHSEDLCRKTLFPFPIHDVSTCTEIPNSGDRNYRCIDSSFCLPKSMMCNGIADCRDGSDEGPFCDKWTTMCTNGTHPCKGNDTRCEPDRFGPACICASAPAFKTYNYATNACEDIDECARARPQCSHTCENVDGNFMCKCDEGFDHNAYENLCFAKGPEALLFYSTSSEISYVKVKSKQDVVLMTNMKQAHGVSFDGTHLYWVETQQGHQAIVRANLNDIKGTKQVLVSLGLEDPGDVVLDWVGGHIYFSDVHRGTISVCKTDGSICSTLRTKTKRPRFVTLSNKHGKMFWADWHQGPVIMWANMDGSQPAVLVDSLVGYATGLAMDSPNGRLYYVDHTVKVIKIDDMQFYSLFDEQYHHPYSIAVFENTVYWSDWTSNSIQTTDKLHSTARKRNVLVKKDTPIYGMHIYHPLIYKPIHNPCENHVCSHLCLISSNVTSVCACPDGMELVNGTKCQRMEHYNPIFIVIGGGSYFTHIEMNVLGNPEAHAIHFDIGRVQAMAYDSKRDTLYVYDGQRKIINYINMTEFKTGVTNLFLYRGLDDVVEMDYDDATDSLYILDQGRNAIDVVSLRTHKRALIHRLESHEVPLSFCVMSEYGRMLVAFMDTEQANKVYIDTMGLDGSNRTHLVSNDLTGPRMRLTYDRNADLVYVADDGNGVIDFIHPEGDKGGFRQTFRQVATSVISMSLADPYLFWTDRKTKLYWANLNEVSENVRRLDFPLFPNDTRLFIQATSHPLDSTHLLSQHPCLTSKPPCTDVCVQIAHSPLPRNKSTQKNIPWTPYTCLCPPGLLKVDGKKCEQLLHCNSDEIYCHKTNKCVLGKYCDGVNECPNAEDELYCEVKLPGKEGCSTGYILCNNVCERKDKCIKTYKTESEQEDECDTTDFKCSNDSLCVERSQVCDGFKDCPGGDDELLSLCEQFTCQPHEFKCTIGSCIPAVFKCDGEPDCTDGSDEIDCPNMTCLPGLFQCRNKQCIEMMRRCDGQQDCLDTSDEEDCGPRRDVIVDPQHNCDDGELACPLNKTLCIPSTARCNMRVDCPGGTDETGCDVHCSPHFLFECKQEHQCVRKSELCNSIKNCADGSDETPEACAQVNKTSRWYPPSLYPAAECHDGFLCGSGQCIEWRNVCDQLPHCFDNSDENGLCKTACQNHSCTYACQPTPQGAHCLCPKGLRTTADHRSCEDINECAHRSVCSQRCHNIPGSFRCSCYHGYSLRPDHRTCKANAGEMSVLYASENTVHSITKDGLTADVYSDPKMAKITDVSVDTRENKLYVSFKEAGKLIEVNSTKNDIVITNVGEPGKVAVDWITGNVYFVDATVGESYIRVCNVLKKRCARLQKLPFNCRVAALVVDPAAKRMFYCETRSGRSVVWSASLSGQYTMDLAAPGDCTGLAADSFSKRLYVAEKKPPRIISMDYNGEDQKLIVYNHTDFQNLHSLALFEDYIYFMNSDSLNLNRCSLFGKKYCKAFIHGTVEATTFVLRHESVQRDDVQDQCRDYECVNVCVMDKHGPICLCDDGQPANNGQCPLLEKGQLPLFNGWTYEQYRRAHNVMASMVSIIVVLLLLYLGVFIYYQYKRGRCTRPINYMEVRFQNRGEEASAAASPVDDNTEEESGVHEFVNPLEYVREAGMQIRGEKRPIGTAGLSINVPPVLTEGTSDTESDLDVKDTTRIVSDK